jgi:predicted MPP superfamily phosphohydrolase
LQNPTRRAFFKAAAVSGLAAATGLGSYGLAEGYSDPVIRKYDLSQDSHDEMATTITLIHITDLHFGMYWGQSELRNLVDNLNALEGDALCITGDVFHSGRTVIEQAIPILKALKDRPLGNFAILGNHEFYAGESRCVRCMEAAGITVLRNQWISIKTSNTTIHIGGIDDPAGYRSKERTRKARGGNKHINEVPTGAGMRILLSHRPDVFPYAARQQIDLVLAGHLHGGQIVVPVPGNKRGLSAAGLASDYVYGWYEKGASRMYVSSGLGMTFLPWRIYCAPEIGVIRIGLMS